MPPRAQRSLSFVDRHDLWSAEQRRAAAAVEREIKRRKLEVIRFAFCDQHGVLRGKTLVASEAVEGDARRRHHDVDACSPRTPRTARCSTVFSAGGGMGLDEMAGAGNFVMVADPATFRVLPWANNTGWVLCDIYFPNGKPVPFSTRALYRDALGKLATVGFDFFAGLEVEFQLFKLVDPKLSPDSLTWPAEAPAVEHTTHGFQYLTESRFDQVDPILEVLRKTDAGARHAAALARGRARPEPVRVHLRAASTGLAAADTMVLFRSAMKQVARRHGYLVSFMCRPRLPNTFASGWHLHQSLLDRKSGKNLFVSNDKTELLSPLGQHYLAGLLAHARAAAAFTTPTINGYKRYHGVNSMAPIQAIWAKDNRGVMIRVLGEPGDPSTHLENRVGEPLANPYLYMASQIHAGLDGIARKLKPGPSADAPYEISAEPLPKSLAEALAALEGQRLLPRGLRRRLRRLSPAHQDGRDRALRRRDRAANPATPRRSRAWEHKEYFDLA